MRREVGVVRCASDKCGSYGWQARFGGSYGYGRRTKFFADRKHGGSTHAYIKAVQVRLAWERKAVRRAW